MSTLVALRLTAVLLFSGSALAQIVAPDCLIVPWGWTFNSLNQNACTVAAYLMSTCNQGSFTINSLAPGYSYTGPSGVDDSNLCKCNTVAYSLISACDACQSSNWITWSEYSFNCTKTLAPSTFPNPVPAGTSVPQWALIDVTLQNNWNSTQSQTTGDSPEIGPGALISASGSSASGTSRATGAGGTPVATTNAGGPTTSPNPAPSGSSSNVGAIAGGVVGGVAAISIAAAAIFFYLRRQHQRAPAASFVVDSASQPPMDEVHQPLSHEGSFPPPSNSPPISTSGTGASVAAMRLYDPNDPTTFPGYQQPSSMPEVSPTRTTFPPYTDSLTTMHTTRPQAPGYHGLPTV